MFFAEKAQLKVKYLWKNGAQNERANKYLQFIYVFYAI